MAKEKNPINEALAEVNEVFLDDEGEAPAVYDENEAVDSGEQINEQLAKSRMVEPVPEGAADFVDQGRVGRAAGIAKTPQTGTKPVPAGGYVDFTQELDERSAVIEQQNVDMILISFDGGRYKTWHFDDLKVVQGFAQNLKGVKRLFKFVSGTSELQEINAMGMSVNR